MYGKTSYRDMRISCASLGIGGRKHGVNEDKRADDLGPQADSGADAWLQYVGAAAVPFVERFLESLD